MNVDTGKQGEPIMMVPSTGLCRTDEDDEVEGPEAGRTLLVYVFLRVSLGSYPASRFTPVYPTLPRSTVSLFYKQGQ